MHHGGPRPGRTERPPFGHAGGAARRVFVIGLIGNWALYLLASAVGNVITVGVILLTSTAPRGSVDGPVAPDTTRRRPPMPSATVTLTNATGLRARPTRVLATAAQGFGADVRAARGGEGAHATSVLPVLALDCHQGPPPSDAVSRPARPGEGGAA